MNKSMAGNLTLIDHFNSAQLAIQAAVSSAFKTPEVIRMFAQKQPDQLRSRLSQLAVQHKLKHIPTDEFNSQSIEILIALKKLEIPLTEAEQQFLDSMSNARHLESIVSDSKIGSASQQNVVSAVKAQVKK